MNNLLVIIIQIGFYSIVGIMSFILILSSFIFIKYATNRFVATMTSLAVIIIFLIGLALAFGSLITVTKIYA